MRISTFVLNLIGIEFLLIFPTMYMTPYSTILTVVFSILIIPQLFVPLVIKLFEKHIKFQLPKIFNLLILINLLTITLWTLAILDNYNVPFAHAFILKISPIFELPSLYILE